MEKKTKLRSKLILNQKKDLQKKTRESEFYKKRLAKLRTQQKSENKHWLIALNNMRDIREEEAQKYEAEIGRLNNLIGIMKTGRIRYESTIEYPVSNNFDFCGAIDKVSGVLFLQEIQQVEVRPDHVLIITNSGREIKLGKAYDYLQDIFSIK
jgi:hypothetical protein